MVGYVFISHQTLGEWNMAYYDWILWGLVLYMTVGSDFGLNWLTGIAFGRRIDKNSSNIFNKIYYYVWASSDPYAGPIDSSLVDDSGKTAKINLRPVEPRIIAICQINMFFTLAVEVLILIGFFTRGDYLQPAAFAFLARALIEIIYGTQLIFGKAGIRGLALWNYLLIGLIPQALTPFLVAMRFASGVGEPHILWWQPLLFIVAPTLLILSIFTVSYQTSKSWK